MTEQPRVFISYSRQDGEAFAQNLRKELIKAGISVWQDRTDMEGGRNWWKQITEALDHVGFMVLVATPSAMESPIVRREWQYARQQGVCIYPVLVEGKTIDFTGLPNWMHKAHFYDTKHEWDKFLIHLQGDCTSNRVPFMAPEVPQNYVTRQTEYENILTSLLTSDQENPIATSVALRGAGGFGKTTLAAALCHDDRIITAFDDGILWVSLGEEPDLLAELTRMVRAISGDKEASFLDVEEASLTLGERLAGLDYLIVIDDVWQATHVRPFMRGGERCARLITTRNFEIAAHTDKHLVIDQMKRDESVELLTARLDDALGDLAPFRDLARRLGEWPLILELVSDSLRSRMARGDSLDGALKWVNKALDKRGVQAFDKDNAVERHQAISRTIDVSMELLEKDDQRRYFELAIFPDDEDIPLSAACALWKLDEFDTEDLIQRFFDLSLLKFDLQAGTFRLHDIIRVYLKEHLGNETALHATLIEGWGDVETLPDNYAWRWLSWHLIAAGQTKSLEAILLNFNWLIAKLRETDPNSLLIDYERALNALDSSDLQLVQSALRNAAHILVSDKLQLAGQLIGRLMSFDSEPLVKLRHQAEAFKDAPWIMPCTASLPQAGGPLLRTIQAHQKVVSSVKILSDGQRIFSASSDGTVKLWNFTTGLELGTFDGHGGKKVNDIIFTADERFMVSAGSDYRINIWDVKKRTIVRSLEGHSRVVDDVEITPDGRIIVSASSDKTVKLWDFESGDCLATLEGHTSMINAVAMAPNGKFAATGSADKTVMLWDLFSKTHHLTLEDHSGFVNAVIFTTDSTRLLSADDNGWVNLWDVHSGELITTIRAHKRGILGLGMSHDGASFVTASADLTLKVWNLSTETSILELAGHTWPVNAVDITRNGHFAISASSDRTIKVWQLTNVKADDDSQSHRERINSVTITPDNKFGISAASDDSLKVWDLATCAIHRTLEGHLGRVNDVAMIPNGRYGVSASADGEIKVWDVVSGVEVRQMEGHSRGTNAVAITPNGKRVVSGGSDGTLKIWTLATGKEVMTLVGHSERVNAIAITPDGNFAVSAAGSFFGRKHDLCLWDLQKGDWLASWVGHERKVNRLAITPDGQRVITVSDDYLVKVWEIQTQREIFSLTGHTERVNAVAISPDGQFIISAGDDGRLILWRLDTGESIAGYNADDALFACAMGADNATVIAGGSSGRVHFLKLKGC